MNDYNHKPRSNIFKTLFLGYLSLFGTNIEGKKFAAEINNNWNNFTNINKQQNQYYFNDIHPDYSDTCSPIKYSNPNECEEYDEYSYRRIALCLFGGNYTYPRNDQFRSMYDLVNASSTLDTIHSIQYGCFTSHNVIWFPSFNISFINVVEDTIFEENPSSLINYINNLWGKPLYCGYDPNYKDLSRGGDNVKDKKLLKKSGFQGYGQEFDIDDIYFNPGKDTQRVNKNKFGLRHIQIKHKIFTDSDIDTCNTDENNIRSKWQTFVKCLNIIMWCGEITKSKTHKVNTTYNIFFTYNYFSSTTNNYNNASLVYIPGDTNEYYTRLQSAYTQYTAYNNLPTSNNIGNNDWEGCSNSVPQFNILNKDDKKNNCKPAKEQKKERTSYAYGELLRHITRVFFSQLGRMRDVVLEIILNDPSYKVSISEKELMADYSAFMNEITLDYELTEILIDTTFDKALTLIDEGVIAVELVDDGELLNDSSALSSNGKSKFIYTDDPNYYEKIHNDYEYSLNWCRRFLHDEYLFNYLGYVLDLDPSPYILDPSVDGGITIKQFHTYYPNYDDAVSDINRSIHGDEFRHMQKIYTNWKRNVLNIDNIWDVSNYHNNHPERDIIPTAPAIAPAPSPEGEGPSSPSPSEGQKSSANKATNNSPYKWMGRNIDNLYNRITSYSSSRNNNIINSTFKFTF